ncbi:unnamed protein product [Trichobilharzia regenti]|nr:unnamed protein product [Trichobilharzia regenti]
MGNSNLCSLKDITTNTTNNNSNINGIVNHSTSDSLQQQFGLRKAKVSM